MGRLINPTNIRQKVGFLIFRKETGRHGELQKGLDRLAQRESFLPSSSRIYGRWKHFSAAPTHFYLVDSRVALWALTPAWLSLEKQRKYDT